MPPLHHTCAVVGLVCVCATTAVVASGEAAGQQPGASAARQAAPDASIRFGGKGTFGRLFQPASPDASAPATREPDVQPPKPRVTCGMVVLPADPSVDPKFTIGRSRRPQPDTEFKIRAVQPRVCWPE